MFFREWGMSSLGKEPSHGQLRSAWFRGRILFEFDFPEALMLIGSVLLVLLVCAAVL